MSEWFIYQGIGRPDPARIEQLPAPPPWRAFDAPAVDYEVPGLDASTHRRLGARTVPLPVQDPDALELVNAALYLRRPLLVTGEPGVGKSTLAHSVAYELDLGRVLEWPVVSRSELRDGLYSYDAIGRLQDAQLPGDAGSQDIGRYIKLGPLGTALLAADKPRVLLIDELDKSDIDLPNDLLNVLEEGRFAIPELERIADRTPEVRVLTDDGRRVTVTGGEVRCRAFPFVVMTSNREREFPAALLRRCIPLDLKAPRDERLAALVQAHFGQGSYEDNRDLVDRFTQAEADGSLRPTDQLLNAIFLAQHAARDAVQRREEISELLMQPLDRGPR
ncbi:MULTISPECIES: AAA family ATPase [Streptomyces]|uniref:AAA family ATPase n=2 Tax=Streptomyces TaxID=1883 RepID=A0A2U9P7C3_STRAS|nr:MULTISPECIES: MoxR family ATPase [Streptomyces]AWT45447.1 AAA family ATPase [Streptomyces actuosus]MBM4822065.1 MoxR family ATPase [Streptomyces actuosus]GHF62515.1 ATPase AAA [Streptomyces griseosporeus]